MDKKDHNVLNIDIKNESLNGWLVSNKHIIIPELIAGAEKILYDDLNDFLPLVKITGKSVTSMIDEIAKSPLTKKIKSTDDSTNKKDEPHFLIALHKDEIQQMLETSMDWCIENEEYELCHRIKLLQTKMNITLLGM